MTATDIPALIREAREACEASIEWAVQWPAALQHAGLIVYGSEDEARRQIGDHPGLDATLLHRTAARGPWEARPMTTSQQCDDHRSNWVDEHGMAHCLMCNVTFPDPDAMAALRAERDILAAELAQARAELTDRYADSDQREGES